jgi:menaquinone-dependent protoporphyrinogen oxidase
MARILIIYGTAYGQTERIAREIAGVLREAAHAVDLVKGDRLPAGWAIDEYDGVVVAASVLFGRHQRYIRAFVREHLARLNAVPSAFVSVCGAMAGSNPEAASMAEGYLRKLLATTGWRPTLTKSFAGGLPYTRYGPWVRWMMKMISRQTGRPTDTSRDYDFTDWSGVRDFARQLADLFPLAAPGVGAGAAAQGRARASDRDEIC